MIARRTAKSILFSLHDQSADLGLFCIVLRLTRNPCSSVTVSYSAAVNCPGVPVFLSSVVREIRKIAVIVLNGLLPDPIRFFPVSLADFLNHQLVDAKAQQAVENLLNGQQRTGRCDGCQSFWNASPSCLIADSAAHGFGKQTSQTSASALHARKSSKKPMSYTSIGSTKVCFLSMKWAKS